MKALIVHKPQEDNAVYLFMEKDSWRQGEKVAMIAGLNKFFRIYYARVKEVYAAV